MRDVDAQILVNQTNNKMLAQAPHPDLSGALFFLPLKGLLGLRQEKKAGTEGGSGAQKKRIYGTNGVCKWCGYSSNDGI
ncbi:hypothetical protein BC670_0798 [Flavobacterium branchiophilum]|uniref:Uncharacterized protein n=2 Tax=Flavobacterium branchiophilum TaxID=55197 RepID=A0A543G1K0_9FLAO|nr:hypothetical protein BC670_0798 [Flavobacterium branchiophilum]